MKAESQDFNDNSGNPDTELCFQCRSYKTIDEFQTPEGRNICKECHEKYLKLCREKGVRFEEVHGRKAKDLFGNEYELTDAYCVTGDERVFIRGYDPARHDYNFPDHEKADIFALKVQFLESGLKGFWLYGKPELLKEYPFFFSVEKLSCGLYCLSGNCYEYSNAFHLRTRDPGQAFDIIGYHTPLGENIRKLVKEQLDRGDIAFTNGDDASDKSLRLKDYSRYDREKKAEEIPLAYLWDSGGEKFVADGSASDDFPDEPEEEVKDRLEIRCPLKNEKGIYRLDVDGRLCEEVWDCGHKQNR